MRRHVVIAALALAYGSTVPILAQQAVQFGPAAWYDFGVPLSLNRAPGAVDWCPCDGRGTSYSHTLLAGAELLLPRTPWLHVSTQARLALGISTGRFRSNPYLTDPVLDPSTGVIVTPTVEFDVETFPLYLLGETALEHELDDNVALATGLWGSWRFASDYTLRERLLSPRPLNAGGFESGDRIILRGSTLGGDPVSAGLYTALKWSIPFGHDRMVRIGLGLRLDATALFDNVGLRALSSGVGLSLLFGDPDPPIAPLQPLPPRSLPRMPRADETRTHDLTAIGRPDSLPGDVVDVERRLSASIDLFSIGRRGERLQQALITATERRTEQECALLPAVYFDRGQSSIPTRYLQLSPDAADRHVRTLTGRVSPVELVYTILNVVGWRLRIYPTESLTVRGSCSADEPSALALARAEAVAGYLRSVWRIEAARIRVEQGPAPGAIRTIPPAAPTPSELRAVELVTVPGSRLLAPHASEWIVEDYRIAPVRLDPSFTAERGISRWDIRISQGGKEIATFSSDKAGSEDHVDLNVLIGDARGPVDPLFVEFEVSDRDGRTTVARDTLDVVASPDSLFEAEDVFARSAQQSHVWIVDGSDLTLSQRGRANRDVLRGIAQRIREGDAITIAPLLEGGSGATLVSEQQRRMQAQHTASVLLIELAGRQAAIKLSGGRYTYDAADSSLPELAFLTSLVAITVERQGR